MEPVHDQRLYSRRYQVTHLIARGGMAMVYRAQDTLLNRAVALKILYPELSAGSAVCREIPTRGPGGGQPVTPEYRAGL